MCAERLPKRILFAELREKEVMPSCHGTNKRCKDQMSRDLQVLGLRENYEVCQDRKEWTDRCKQGVDQVASCRERNSSFANSQTQGRCVCGQTFRRQGDFQDANASVGVRVRHHYSPELSRALL